MNWQDILKSIAPTVASAMLGPMGGMAISAIGSILGVDNATQDKIKDVIAKGQLTNDQLAELQTLEMKYKDLEAERGFKFTELEFKDKDSARNMQIATHSKMPAILTILVTIGFFGTLGMLFFFPELKDNQTVLVMIGQLSGGWMACLTFYVGTTYGSNNKNVMLANSMPAK